MEPIFRTMIPLRRVKQQSANLDRMDELRLIAIGCTERNP